VAQFPRAMNPVYRASSPQPSMFESHHDPNNPLAKEMGLGSAHADPIPQDYISVPGRQPPQQMQQPQPAQQPRGVQPDPRLVQAQQQAAQHYQQSQVPHNDYPADGMTQFCRIGPPSERSTNPSPVRPDSRDSESDYSNPTSFSSIEPPSGSASPGKPMAPAPAPAPAISPLVDESQVQKKRGFFQNHSPFRRKSKHENQLDSGSITPSARDTWAPTSRNNENTSPTRPFGRGASRPTYGAEHSASPEPVDPRANFQLNIGNNVFDVASPDGRKQNKPQKEEPAEELDPIAQALAELKGVTKQSSLRVSADRYHGLATPAPPGTPGNAASPLPGGMPTPITNVNLNAAQRGTPPPSYEQPPVSRLGAPKPAHTARAMRQTTERYVNQKADMFNTGASSRPSTRGGPAQDVPRATSPAPPRATSPRPGLYQSQSRPSADYQRSASPNPYAPSTSGRPRAQTQNSSPVKPSPYGNPTSRGSYASSRGGSPGHAAVPRAVSPQPPQPVFANTRPNSRAAPSQSRAASPNPAFRQSYDRPSSSRGSDMALQIAPGPGSERGDGSVYGGSARGRNGGGGQRPQSSYYSNPARPMSGYGNGGGSQISNRERSKSLAEPRQYTKDGRMILHYCKYPFPLSLLSKLGVSEV
jgi:hypothetical protein